jgi:acyl dehydratase
MLVLKSIGDFEQLVGTELGSSEWHDVTHERVVSFASATGDFEGIHVDDASARRAGLTGAIAHGLYVLSLGPKLFSEIVVMDDFRLAFNYGFDRVRFIVPVPVGSRVRLVLGLASMVRSEGSTRACFTQTFELEGSSKPACVAENIVLFLD